MTTNGPSTLPAAPPSANVVALSVIVLVGCPPALEARCRAVAAKARALVRTTTNPFPPATVRRLRPLVLVIPEQVFVEAPDDLEVLAESVGAQLVVLESAADALDELEGRVLDALAFAVRLRRRASARRAHQRR